MSTYSALLGVRRQLSANRAATERDVGAVKSLANPPARLGIRSGQFRFPD